MSTQFDLIDRQIVELTKNLVRIYSLFTTQRVTVVDGVMVESEICWTNDEAKEKYEEGGKLLIELKRQRFVNCSGMEQSGSLPGSCPGGRGFKSHSRSQ